MWTLSVGQASLALSEGFEACLNAFNNNLELVLALYC